MVVPLLLACLLNVAYATLPPRPALGTPLTILRVERAYLRILCPHSGELASSMTLVTSTGT